MIEITRFEDKYLDGLKKMMKMENLEFEDVSLCLDSLFVVANRLDVLGFGYYNVYGDEIYIDHIYIKTNERLSKFGDSLFRAILNSLTLQGVTEVFMRNDELYAGFLKAENIALIEDRFVIETGEFFSRKCRGTKEKKLQ